MYISRKYLIYTQIVTFYPLYKAFVTIYYYKFIFVFTNQNSALYFLSIYKYKNINQKFKNQNFL